MQVKENSVSKKGISIISREAVEARLQNLVKHKEYWEQFEQKKGAHLAVKDLLFKMQEQSNEFLIMPRLLERFFLLYLNKHHPSQQNKQLALNVARVFALLVHQYYKSATKFNMKCSFYVSPSVWEKWLVGRKAKESGINILKEMGVIISYRFNRRKLAPAEFSRFVIMYQFNLQKVKWLYGCVKAVSVFEEDKRNDRYEGQESDYAYDDIIEDSLGFIENAVL